MYYMNTSFIYSFLGYFGNCLFFSLSLFFFFWFFFVFFFGFLLLLCLVFGLYGRRKGKGCYQKRLYIYEYRNFSLVFLIIL